MQDNSSLTNLDLLYRYAGITLEATQNLEFILANFIVVSDSKNHGIGEDIGFSQVQKFHADKTFGALVKAAKPLYPDYINVQLEQFVDKRNEFIHHFFHLVRGKEETQECYPFLDNLISVKKEADGLSKLLADAIHIIVNSRIPNAEKKCVEGANKILKDNTFLRTIARKTKK